MPSVPYFHFLYCERALFYGLLLSSYLLFVWEPGGTGQGAVVLLLLSPLQKLHCGVLDQETSVPHCAGRSAICRMFHSPALHLLTANGAPRNRGT